MPKLSGWTPPSLRGTPKRRVHETSHPIDDETDFFSLTTFDKVQVLTTRGALLTRFYEWNNWEDGMNPWISMVLDPEQYTPPGVHSWWIVHYQSYHVHIEHSMRSVHGIHRARLFYKQDDGPTLWLASAQLGPLYFFSRNLLTEAYFEVLAKKLFFMTEKESAKVVAR